MIRSTTALARLALLIAFTVGCAVAQPGSGAGPASTGQAQSSRLQIAEALFQAHCKAAGERIYRTAENVESVFLMKVRSGATINYDDQFAMDDPYGRDGRGENYIKSFLADASGKPGYRFVEAIDPKDKKPYRYTGKTRDVVHTQSVLMGGDGKTKFTTRDFVLDRTPVAALGSRYGVTYDDISTQQDREYWIAGSSLKVVDLRTHEVIAERIGYMMDVGQGNTSGGRSPWLLAAYHACPPFPNDPGRRPVQEDQTRNFVIKVLKP